MSSPTVTLAISPRGAPIHRLPPSCTVARSAPTAELYDHLAARTGLSIHRLRVTKGSDGHLVPNNKDTPLDTTGLMDGSKIYVKDLGPQIGWRTCFLIEYLGPLLIHPLIYLLRPHIYPHIYPLSTRPSFPPPSPLQTLSLLLITTHFFKRLLETLFIHRFSATTMPLRNIFKNCAHYWLLAGLNLALWIYAPSSPTASPAPLLAPLGLALFAAGELLNLRTHLVLRGLRPAGGVGRGIPRGWGFGWCTCPNYLFEIVAWVGLGLVTRSVATGLFLAVGAVQMGLWARKKERGYRREFGGRYQPKRWVVVPGVY